MKKITFNMRVNVKNREMSEQKEYKNGTALEETTGYLVKSSGLLLVIHKGREKGWVISEYLTGMNIGRFTRTRKEAVAYINNLEQDMVDKIEYVIGKALNEHGFANQPIK